jgi:hypothetical protein
MIEIRILEHSIEISKNDKKVGYVKTEIRRGKKQKVQTKVHLTYLFKSAARFATTVLKTNNETITTMLYLIFVIRKKGSVYFKSNFFSTQYRYREYLKTRHSDPVLKPEGKPWNINIDNSPYTVQYINETTFTINDNLFETEVSDLIMSGLEKVNYIESVILTVPSDDNIPDNIIVLAATASYLHEKIRSINIRSGSVLIGPASTAVSVSFLLNRLNQITNRLPPPTETDETFDEQMNMLCNTLCNALKTEDFLLESTSEISGLFENGILYSLGIGNEHSTAENPVRYCYSVEESMRVVGFHTHPNDYNEILYNSNVTLDFPSGADILVDLQYADTRVSPDGTLWYKNIFQAVVVPSLRNNQIGIFMYRSKAKTIQHKHIPNNVKQGYYQLVKNIYLMEGTIDKPLDLFCVMDSAKMNQYLDKMQKTEPDTFEEKIHGPRNLSFGTGNWPYNGPPFTIEMFQVTWKICYIK